MLVILLCCMLKVGSHQLSVPICNPQHPTVYSDNLQLVFKLTYLLSLCSGEGGADRGAGQPLAADCPVGRGLLDAGGAADEGPGKARR